MAWNRDTNELTEKLNQVAKEEIEKDRDQVLGVPNTGYFQNGTTGPAMDCGQVGYGASTPN